MPRDFNICRRNGGKIRTVSGPNKQYGLGPHEYMHVCVLNNEVYKGEIKVKKESSQK